MAYPILWNFSENTGYDLGVDFGGVLSCLQLCLIDFGFSFLVVKFLLKNQWLENLSIWALFCVSCREYVKIYHLILG